MSKDITFPLVDSSYDNQEILRCIATLLEGQLTMGARVREFESAFADYLGARYAVMVNSGSSANLLAFAALTNPARRNHLIPGDKVAVPAVCWSTSLWPIIQCGLVPVLVDVDAETLNLSIPSLKAAICRHSIKAVMMVHILGNSTELPALMELVHEHHLHLIEDTCESLGSRYRGKHLGTLGEFGTFSFYFSHHMTTIEGGMIVARTEEDYDLLKCLRAHGWSREQSNRRELESQHAAIDPRFLFINIGYNLRPTEIQAAFGCEQLKRLECMNQSRRDNVRRLRVAFSTHSAWEGQIAFPRVPEALDPAWFGFPFLLTESSKVTRQIMANNLLKRGIDTRPIVSGNMALQPALKLYKVDLSLGPFFGAQQVHDRGLFIGCHSTPLSESRIQTLVDAFFEALKEIP